MRAPFTIIHLVKVTVLRMCTCIEITNHAMNKEKETSLISKAYLVFYNVALCIGWGYVLTGAILYYWSHRPALGGHVPGLYDAVGTSLRVFQTAAFLEVSEHNSVCCEYEISLSGDPLCNR